MQSFYQNAFFTQSARVLGVRLNGLTLGQAFALECSQSPFARDHKPSEISIDDFIFAVMLCTYSWQDIQSRFNGEQKKTLRQSWSEFRWGAMIGKKIKNKQIDLAGELATFYEYLNAQCAGPERWNTSGNGGEIAAPTTLAMAWVLMGGRYSARSFAEVMNLTMPEATALISVRGSIEGDESLKTDTEIQASEILKQMRQSNGAS